ncbi:MAG: hypothetical protein U5K54_09870 [Cytophagales bacterium]|nr:hypothetical protein [Cytophagales bacterium]
MGAGVASALTWQCVSRRNRIISANEKINVGVIGVNGMGWSDLTSFHENTKR